MLKGPNRSYVVVLGKGSSLKNVPNGTKNAREQNSSQTNRKFKVAWP